MSRILIYTDEPVLAEGARATLSCEPALRVVGVVTRAAELAPNLRLHTPDVLLMGMPPTLALDGIGDIRREFPACRIALWVRSSPVEFALRALKLGVHGILPRALTSERLIEALRNIAEDGLQVDLFVSAGVLEPKKVHLSKRESQLLGLLCQGLKNKEIAAELSLAEGSVKVYLSRLFQKTGAKDRYELALFGFRHAGSASPQGAVRS